MKKNFVEGWRDLQGASRAAFDLFACASFDMMPSAAEAVDVIFFEFAAPNVESVGVGASVLLDDVEFQNGPFADFIEPKTLGHAQVRNSGWWRAAGGLLGNWFHSRPSSSRPPVLGDHPPHCLKKIG
jgi:hypothetical protein